MFFYIPTLSQGDDSAILRGQSPTRNTPPNDVHNNIFKFPKLPGAVFEPGSAATPLIKSATLPTELPLLIKGLQNHHRVVWYQNNGYFFLIRLNDMLFIIFGHIWEYPVGYDQKWSVSTNNSETVTRATEWAVTSHPLELHQLSAEQWRVQT